MVKTLRFHCRGRGLIPSRGTKIPRARASAKENKSQNKRQIKTNVGKVVEKQEALDILDGNKKWYSHFRKLEVSQKVEICLPYDPAIPIFGVFPRAMKTYIST